MAILRAYELCKQRGLKDSLRCEVRRFRTDVHGELIYDFGTGVLKVWFPSSWTSTEISDEVRRFFELVHSKHWFENVVSDMITEEQFTLF